MSIVRAGNQINSTPYKPNLQILERLKVLPITILDDAMNRMQGLSSSICSINHVRIQGTAFTVKVPEGDNLFIHEALDRAAEHEILVVSCTEESRRALAGELMIRQARLRNIAGLIIDGYVRDYDYIMSVKDFGVFAKGVSANGPYKNGPGEIECAVAIGHQVICPGDYLCADEDGIVVIPRKEILPVLEKAEKLLEKEKNIKQKINEKAYFKTWKQEKMLSVCPYVDEMNEGKYS